jgi:hypothetical protein
MGVRKHVHEPITIMDPKPIEVLRKSDVISLNISFLVTTKHLTTKLIFEDNKAKEDIKKSCKKRELNRMKKIPFDYDVVS